VCSVAVCRVKCHGSHTGILFHDPTHREKTGQEVVLSRVHLQQELVQKLVPANTWKTGKYQWHIHKMVIACVYFNDIDKAFN